MLLAAKGSMRARRCARGNHAVTQRFKRLSRPEHWYAHLRLTASYSHVCALITTAYFTMAYFQAAAFQGVDCTQNPNRNGIYHIA